MNDDDDGWEYVEEGPAEIIWKGNEIIVKKKKIRVPKKTPDIQTEKQVIDGEHKSVLLILANTVDLKVWNFPGK